MLKRAITARWLLDFCIVGHGGIVALGVFCAEYYVTEQHFKPGKI